jgi:hypothetical protein
MPSQTPSVAESTPLPKTSVQTVKPQVPPEEQFWERYSPHHEAPLSGVGSFAIHFLIASFLILAGYLGWLGLGSRRAAVSTDVVRLESGGGGGKKTGTSDEPGDGGTPKEAVDAEPKTDQPKTSEVDVVRPDLKDVNIETQKLPPQDAKDANARFIKEANENARAFSSLDEEMRRKLREGLTQAPRGKGGPGSGGGEGKGTGPGTGDGRGPGNSTLSQREKRMLRWTMMFDTRSGQDYLRQLRGLGAILAIPKDRSGGDYWIIRDLGGHPPQLLDEDVRQIQRIFWIDDKPPSVASVMRALGLNMNPDRFVAFMPQELEEKLFEMELRFRGLREDDIEETVFQVRVVGGRYTPFVISQREKR